MHVLGLDIGKDTVFAHLRLEQGAHHALNDVPNTRQGFDRIIRWAAQHGARVAELHAVMEPTGVYWERCATHLHSLGCRVSVVNPLAIKYFARSNLRRGKTDALDADIIARFGETMQPRAWSPPSDALRSLKQLLRERRALVATLTAELNRLHASQHRLQSDELVVALIRERIALLRSQVKTLGAAMRALISSDPILERAQDLLLSVPGFGFISAVTVLAETDNFALLETGEQISAYAGIAPAPFESGSSVHGRGHISRLGNAHLRHIAYLASLAARRSPRFGAFYDQLRARGKPVKVALVALGRKLLRTALAVVRSGRAFDEGYVRPLDVALPSSG
jgi:transposase